MEVCSGVWWCVEASGGDVEVCSGVWRWCSGVWRCVVGCSGVWRCVVVCGGVWRCVVGCSGVWRCVVVVVVVGVRAVFPVWWVRRSRQEGILHLSNVTGCH